jgi:nucleotide-binding universal stress UspA family protein
MRHIRKILVPVDFAAGARAAVEVAAAMARRFAATVELYHVWQPPALLPAQQWLAPDGSGVARGIADARLHEVAWDMRKAGVARVRCHVSVGDPAHDICELAAKDGFDLIIMGTHGRTGLARAFLGSVSAKVMRHAPCPVMTVRLPKRPLSRWAGARRSARRQLLRARP